MNILTVSDGFLFERQVLEQLAIKQVCACQYYDLADYMDVMSNQELLDIINQAYDCDMCGLKGGQL